MAFTIRSLNHLKNLNPTAFLYSFGSSSLSLNKRLDRPQAAICHPCPGRSGHCSEAERHMGKVIPVLDAGSINKLVTVFLNLSQTLISLHLLGQKPLQACVSNLPREL